MRRSAVSLLPLILIGLFSSEPAKAQAPAALQSGKPIERSIASGESHSFTLNLEADQFAQLVIDQRGIDVIVRIFSPAGKALGEFDSPNGKEGPENFSLTSVEAGAYRIDVAPLGQMVDPPPGRYEIKVLEVRAATEQELHVVKNQEAYKARALGLLSEVADSASQLRVLRTRVKTRLQTAELLWESNEKVATRLLAEAIDEVKEFLAKADSGEDYYQAYSLGMQLRSEVLNVVAQHDPEMALGFLRSTRPTSGPEEQRQSTFEGQLELTLANQIIAKDPKVAVRIAQDIIKKGYSPNIIEIIVRLRANEPEKAAQLAKDLAAKLMSEKLLKEPDAAALAVNLLRIAHAPAVRFPPYPATPSPPKTDIPLLSEREYKDLFDKALNEALSVGPATNDEYSPERAAAQNILSTLKSSMSSEMSSYAAANIPAMDKKLAELSEPEEEDPGTASWQKYQEKINSGSMDAAVEEVHSAPEELREGLSQLVVQKAISTGEFARARQLVKDTVTNPGQRWQVLAQLDWMEILQDASKGKTEEALRAVANLRTSRQRALIISQIVSLIGPGLTRAKALELLEQARSLVGSSVRVENSEQMSALLEIARAFSHYDDKRAFEVVEPLLDQFNEMSAAALVLDGFGEQIYQDGELQLVDNNAMGSGMGSGLGRTGTQLVEVLGSLSRINFDRAKAGADRIARQEVQILAYLTIAQRSLVPGEPPRQAIDMRRFGGRTID